MEANVHVTDCRTRAHKMNYWDSDKQTNTTFNPHPPTTETTLAPRLKCSEYLDSTGQSPDGQPALWKTLYTALRACTHSAMWETDTDHHQGCPYLQTHKYPACSDADWQLEQLYMPVIPVYSGMYTPYN